MSPILGFNLKNRLIRAIFDAFWPYNEYKFLIHWFFYWTAIVSVKTKLLELKLKT